MTEYHRGVAQEREDAAGDEFWAAPSLGLSPLSSFRLDELLRELQNRVGDVMASRERLSALLDAVVGVGSDLDLRSTWPAGPARWRTRRSSSCCCTSRRPTSSPSRYANRRVPNSPDQRSRSGAPLSKRRSP